MAWPKKTLTEEGFNKFKSPIANVKGKTPWKVDESLEWTENWRDYTGQVYNYEKDEPDDSVEWNKSGVTLGVLASKGLGLDYLFSGDLEGPTEHEKSGLSYWGIKNNPVFENAAKAKGIDWDSFINTYSDALTYQNTRDASILQWNENTLGDHGATKTVTWHHRYGEGSKEVPVDTPAPHNEVFGLDERVAGSAEIMTQMYNMNKFIYDSIKNWEKEYDAPIIEEGPTDAQYGLPKGTDPWEFYGLNKLPRILPKELDVDYEFNLMDPKASGATYRTPKGYPKIDLDAVETAKPGSSFTNYLADFDFAQEHGYWDYDMGNTGDEKYQQDLSFIFGDDLGDIRIFGQKDYDALIEQGQDDDGVIKTIEARLARGQKLIMGPAMAEKFDMYSYDATWWGQPEGSIGQKGVRLLRLQGLDDAGIMSRYAKGRHSGQIGQWVKDNFGVRVWPETGMYDYYFMDPGGKKAFGMQDYNQLLDQGMDTSRIKQIAKDLTRTGWTLGPDAAEIMGLKGFQAGVTIEANGGYLSGEVFNTYMNTGWDHDKLIELALSDKTITIGGEAAEKLFGWKDKGGQGDFGMKDILENWPDGPIDRPDRVTLGKIAGGVAGAIGPDAVDYIWGDKVYDQEMAPPTGADPSHFTFGMNTINHLRNHSTNPVRSNKTLAAIAKGAYWIGEEAAKELGIPANKPPVTTPPTLHDQLTTPIEEYDKPDLISGEYGGFGQQEIDWMLSANWDYDQMRAVTENFDRIGPAAAEYLWGGQLTAQMQAPANAVDPSKTTFGKETIKWLDLVDPGISDKSLAAIARGTADYVGEGALEYFADKDIDVGKGPAPKRAAPSRPQWVDQGDKGAFGMADANWLSSRGYSDAEMRKIAAGTDKIGEDVARKLWGYTNPSNPDFGQEDYNQLKGNGASDDVMRKIIRGMGLQTGPKFKHLG